MSTVVNVERIIRVKTAMMRAGVKPANVARDAGVTVQAISHVVLGRRRSKTIREAICRATGKSYEELWGEDLNPAGDVNVCNPIATAGGQYG